MAKQTMSTLLLRTQEQRSKMQIQLQWSPSETLQCIVVEAVGLLGVNDRLDLLAAYHPDRLVWALELTYDPPKKDWDFEKTWTHQYNRAVAWRYVQECLIVKQLYTKDQIEMAQQILINFDLDEILKQKATLAVKYSQIRAIEEVLSNAV